MIKKIFRKVRLKGMTLVEVIVALGVFTIMTTAMAMCAGSVSKIVTENIFFNRKMNEQRVIVDNMNDVGDDNVTDMKITFTLGSTTYVLNTNKNTAEENYCHNGLNFKYVRQNN